MKKLFTLLMLCFITLTFAQTSKESNISNFPLPTLVFFLALISTIGTYTVSQLIDRYYRVSYIKQDLLCLLYFIMVPALLWSYLFYLLN